VIQGKSIHVKGNPALVHMVPGADRKKPKAVARSDHLKHEARYL